MATYAPFTPSDSEHPYPPSYTRGCCHEFSRGFFCGYLHYRPRRKSFTTLRPSSLTRHGWIRLAPIVQYSPLLPPVGVWAVSQSQCGRSEEHTSELQSRQYLVCRLLLEKKKNPAYPSTPH